MANKPTEKKTTTKRKATVKKESVKLDPNKFYNFIVTSPSKHMKKGTYKNIDGVMCEILIKKGLGNVEA